MSITSPSPTTPSRIKPDKLSRHTPPKDDSVSLSSSQGYTSVFPARQSPFPPSSISLTSSLRTISGTAAQPIHSQSRTPPKDNSIMANASATFSFQESSPSIHPTRESTHKTSLDETEQTHVNDEPPLSSKDFSPSHGDNHPSESALPLTPPKPNSPTSRSTGAENDSYLGSLTDPSNIAESETEESSDSALSDVSLSLTPSAPHSPSQASHVSSLDSSSESDSSLDPQEQEAIRNQVQESLAREASLLARKQKKQRKRKEKEERQAQLKNLREQNQKLSEAISQDRETLNNLKKALQEAKQMENKERKSSQLNESKRQEQKRRLSELNERDARLDDAIKRLEKQIKKERSMSSSQKGKTRKSQKESSSESDWAERSGRIQEKLEERKAQLETLVDKKIELEDELKQKEGFLKLQE
ncbi:hypothetical protein BLNAU_6739 [Blattamonas nauphoetae]|uniref:Uncharacterized protein n=1 Tax=Blattamonas nauphoetae TaxID=2049346 RepID=A0ABQ9Y3C1_9EUKA|nr:hypothetical protein BLNAU_6739 [Blattamonas nauphoetae]